MKSEQRYQNMLSELKQHQCVWILVDEHGCVMLNTEDEDCVPIWSNETDAKAWATDEWQHCEVKSIDLDEWLNKWTNGLISDEICIAAHPISDDEGLILYPEEFADDIER